MNVSLIIPTHNRAEILKKTIEALFRQSEKPKQIIIIDDGSTDSTQKWIKNLFNMGSKSNAQADTTDQFQAEMEGIELQYLKQKNQGQGIARNLGIQKATGDIILLIGDDIIGSPNLVEEHRKIHEKHPESHIAVLGKIDWHPELKITPFMEWLTNGSSILGKYGGHQFAYEKLEGKEEADYNFFYTSNISLKTKLLKHYPFDPEFQKYGWEDIELGYRLTKKENLKIFYNPLAAAYHYHPMSEDSLAPRMRQIGASAKIIQKKYPELHKVPSRKKIWAFLLLSNPLSLFFFNMVRKILPSRKTNAYYYYARSKKYFLEGL